MERLDFQALDAIAEDFDASVLASGTIDHFCSSTDWVLPAALELMPGREPWIYREGSCFWAFCRSLHPEGFHYLEPLEAMWALASPLVGDDLDGLVAGVESFTEMPPEQWTLMAMSGMPTSHPLFAALVRRLAPRFRLGLGASTVRLVADLHAGIDAYLARRSKGMRRSLRRAEVRAQREGVSFEDASAMGAAALFERILRVEAKAWKGLVGVGITEGAMHGFYREMLPRLHRRRAHRVLFARLGDEDVAYIFGGLRSGCYRGLQFSYDSRFGHLGLGNLLQLEQMRRLCEEGVDSYDLGTTMDYKLRWCDLTRETATLLLLR